MERKYIKADVGVIIGRFQVHELHAGHKELLNWVGREHRNVIIVLGVPAVPGLLENPLDFQCRYDMIKAEYPTYMIVPLKDTKHNDTWSNNLDCCINNILIPNQSVTLYGSRNSFISSYTGKFSTQELTGDNHLWSGTDIRNELGRGIIRSKEFRAGIIWASQHRYRQTLPTVDICIYNSDKTKILLGRKPAESLFRFVGGFAEPESVCYEDDAKREVKEETGLDVHTIKYIGSMLVNDWRYKYSDKIKTLFFTAITDSVEYKAGDDIIECKWFNVVDIKDNILVEEHRKLLCMLPHTT